MANGKGGGGSTAGGRRCLLPHWPSAKGLIRSWPVWSRACCDGRPQYSPRRGPCHLSFAIHGPPIHGRATPLSEGGRVLSPPLLLVFAKSQRVSTNSTMNQKPRALRPEPTPENAENTNVFHNLAHHPPPPAPPVFSPPRDRPGDHGGRRAHPRPGPTGASPVCALSSLPPRLLVPLDWMARPLVGRAVPGEPVWKGAGGLENRQERLGGDASPHHAPCAGLCKRGFGPPRAQTGDAPGSHSPDSPFPFPSPPLPPLPLRPGMVNGIECFTKHCG